MSQIKGKDTSIEVIVRKYLFAKGFRYRKNVKDLPGKPDIVLPKYKTVVFVHGCFWHHHEGCKYFRWPENNAEFWREKINRNVERDRYNTEDLMKAGWKVRIVWECSLKNNKDEELTALVADIRNNQ